MTEIHQDLKEKTTKLFQQRLDIFIDFIFPIDDWMDFSTLASLDT